MRTEASEPLVAYNTPNLQGLKNRIIESLDTAVDEEKLQRCLESVSYTHLPQLFGLSRHTLRLMRRNFFRTMAFHLAGVLVAAGILYPAVSYTHLDVYKRQV